MRLLPRYLLRQLIAPFCFSLAAATSLMLLNQIAKRFGALVGKGLPWSVITEVFVLSLPFILAMTIPMAVLLAVLYALSHLAADNEVMALRATGVSVPQMLRPLLAWGVLMSALTFLFIDLVLPNSNARLRGLLIDIGRKKPTFELREQVINEVPPSKYFLRSSRIDGATGRLLGITIYDVGDETVRRVIYADSGFMAYAPGGRDLTLRLYDGSIHQYRPDEPERFQVTRFATNEIRVRNVFDELERNTSDQIRGDREMSSCAMLSVVRDAEREQAKADADRKFLVQRDLRELLGLPALRADTGAPPVPGDYCVWLEQLRAKLPSRLLPIKAAAETPGAASPAPPPQAPERQVAERQVADTPASPARTAARQPSDTPPGIGQASLKQRPDTPGRAKLPVPPHRQPTPGGRAPVITKPADTATARVITKLPAPHKGPGAAQGARKLPNGFNPPAATPQADSTRPPPVTQPRLTNRAEVSVAIDRAKDADLRADRYMVEVHKKWAISLACVSFVLIGMAMALRFPRGGMGLVIGGGLAVFSVYYVGLTAGEALSDRGLLSPALSMWLPNIIMTVLGGCGLIVVNRQPGLNRGGDFRELVDGLRYALRWRRRSA